MNVTLRQQTLKDGRQSLFLDYYLPKAKQTRKKETLKLYLYPNPKSKSEKEHNKKVSLLAESIRSKRLLQLQHEDHDFSHLIKDKDTHSERNFIAFFRELTNKKINQKASYGIWNSTLHYLIAYTGNKHIRIKDIDKEWIEGFKVFLQSEEASTQGKTLSINTCHVYFSKFRSSLKTAYKDKLIAHNPCEDIVHIQQEETEREFLTLEELKKALQTKCSYPLLKKAFIFSALTGLRKSDILKMTWKELQHSNEQGWYLRFTQKKTKGVETLPISDQARALLETAGEPEALVFKGLKYDGSTSIKIQRWMLKAGISKPITFHCARHTFATLQLTMGTDIYTVSKLLGHKELKTTQVYAKIIDKKKVEAVNRIPDLDL
ncbi:site-specific integrase [Aquimarina sp. RZ0]|uniref:site-specific integrase n=1 Tax=Aquimarina sp. RZ0 TaxID=2607730 RepID=UPI0011F1DD5F|nr:site-specific integrase [Aquimarina sp. RZ0]KAA1243324.1 site-specific integrase [Aquimarina sp. RZ0]